MVTTPSIREQRLCGQVRSLLLRQYFSDFELSRLDSKAMKSTGSDNSVTAEPSIELTVHQEIDDSIDGENEIVLNRLSYTSASCSFRVSV